MPLGDRDAPYFPRAERVRRFGTALMVTVCFMAAVIIGARLFRSRCRPCGLPGLTALSRLRTTGTFAILAFRVHLRVSQQFAIDLKALVDTFVPVADDAGSGTNGTTDDDDSSLTETLVGYVSPSLAAMCVASGLNLVFIVIFNQIYRYAARVLTICCCGLSPSRALTTAAAVTDPRSPRSSFPSSRLITGTSRAS